MSRQRLCEISVELRPAVMRMGEGGDVDTVRAWAGLRCPRSGGHCDPTRKCLGMNAQNRLTISKIQDELFVKGFVHIQQKEQ